MQVLVKHELEKLATDRTDDKLDDAPLSRDDCLVVTGAFKTMYDWFFPASRMVGDGFLEKIRKQFQMNAVSFMVVNRTTCLAEGSSMLRQGLKGVVFRDPLAGAQNAQSLRNLCCTR